MQPRQQQMTLEKQMRLAIVEYVGDSMTTTTATMMNYGQTDDLARQRGCERLMTTARRRQRRKRRQPP